MTLFQVRSKIGPLPKQLDSLTFTAALVPDGTPLTSPLDALPESLRVLKLDAVSNLMDIALPPRLATLQLCGVRRLGPLPVSLTISLLEHCWLPLALQLPATLTHAHFGINHCLDAPPRMALDALPLEARRHVPRDLPPGLATLSLLLDPVQALPPPPPALLSLDLSYNTRGDNAPGRAPPPPLPPLPERLETLKVAYVSRDPSEPQPALGALTCSLTSLDLQGSFGFDAALGALPPRLARLALGSRFTRLLGALPRGLRELRICGTRFGRLCVYRQPLGALPPALEVLDLGLCLHFNSALGALPDALRELRLGDSFDQPLAALPDSLEVLDLGNNFAQVLPRALPAALREFRMGDSFTQPVVLPEGLQVLTIGLNYEHELRLTANLRELRIGESYTHAVPPLPLARVVRARAYPFDVVCKSIETADGSDTEDSKDGGGGHGNCDCGLCGRLDTDSDDGEDSGGGGDGDGVGDDDDNISWTSGYWSGKDDEAAA